MGEARDSGAKVECRTDSFLRKAVGYCTRQKTGPPSREVMRFALILTGCALALVLAGCISFKKKRSDLYIDPVVRMETELDLFFGELDKEARTMRYGQKSMLIIK